MINTNTAMSWGQELGSLEMQNTKGGDWFGLAIGAVVIDFLINLWMSGGNVAKAAEQTGIDIAALIKAFDAFSSGSSQN